MSNKKNNIISQIYKKDVLKRYLFFIIGLMLMSFSYNVFILPNDIVFGVGGLGVIFYRTMNIDPSIIILIGSIILLILSYFLLGREQTTNSVIGSLLYPVFIKIMSPICSYVDLGTTELIVLVICGAVVTGVGLGFVFKSGFTTGGTDIMNQIISKFFKMSLGKSMLFTDGIIIFSSFFVFGFQKFIYSIISIYIIGIIIDKVILGISKSKSFYIITENEDEIRKFILNDLHHGVTVLQAKGGYTGNSLKVIMCVIPTKEYFKVKEGIKTIDKNAFFLVTDTYEVFGER